MRSVRCDVCGTKALMAASKCPKCGHEIEVRDGFGALLPLAHCSTCDSFYPEKLGACKWCGTKPERAPIGPHVWKGVGIAAFVAMAWGAWLVHDDPPAEVSKARLQSVLKPDSSEASSKDSATSTESVASTDHLDSLPPSAMTGVELSDTTMQALAATVAPTDSTIHATSTGVVALDSALAQAAQAAEATPQSEPVALVDTPAVAPSGRAPDPPVEVPAVRTPTRAADVPPSTTTEASSTRAAEVSAARRDDTPPVRTAEAPPVRTATRSVDTPAARLPARRADALTARAPARVDPAPVRASTRTAATRTDPSAVRARARTVDKAPVPAPKRTIARSAARAPVRTAAPKPAPRVASASKPVAKPPTARPRTRSVWVNSIVRSWVVVRAEASSGGRIIASVGPHTRVQLGESRGGWRRIRAKGLAGWVEHERFFAYFGSWGNVGRLAARD